MSYEYWVIIAPEDPGFSAPISKIPRIIEILREYGAITESLSDMPEGEIRTGAWDDPGTPIPFSDIEEAKQMARGLGVKEMSLRFEKARPDFVSLMVVRRHQYSPGCTHEGTYIINGPLGAELFGKKINRKFSICIYFSKGEIDHDYRKELIRDLTISNMLDGIARALGTRIKVMVHWIP